SWVASWESWANAGLMTIMPPTIVNIARERNFFFILWFIGKSSALEVVSCRRGLALARPEAGRGHAVRQRWTSETRVHPFKPPLSICWTAWLFLPLLNLHVDANPGALSRVPRSESLPGNGWWQSPPRAGRNCTRVQQLAVPVNAGRMDNSSFLGCPQCSATLFLRFRSKHSRNKNNCVMTPRVMFLGRPRHRETLMRGRISKAQDNQDIAKDAVRRYESMHPRMACFRRM